MDFDIVPLHYGSTRVDTGYRRVIPKKKMASWNLAFFGCKLYLHVPLHVPSIYCITRVLRRTGCCTCCVPVSVGDAELGENHSSRRRLDMNHPPTHTPCPPWNRCNISWCRHSRHFYFYDGTKYGPESSAPLFRRKPKHLMLIRSNGRRPRPRMIVVVVVVTAVVVTVFVGSGVGCRAPETFSTQYLLLLLLLLW